jgi:hypothetical protein
MNVHIPTLDEIGGLLTAVFAAAQQYAFGCVLLILLMLSVALVGWTWRAPLLRSPTRTSTSALPRPKLTRRRSKPAKAAVLRREKEPRPDLNRLG